MKKSIQQLLITTFTVILICSSGLSQNTNLMFVKFITNQGEDIEGSSTHPIYTTWSALDNCSSSVESILREGTIISPVGTIVLTKTIDKASGRIFHEKTRAGGGFDEIQVAFLRKNMSNQWELYLELTMRDAKIVSHEMEVVKQKKGQEVITIFYKELEYIDRVTGFETRFTNDIIRH